MTASLQNCISTFLPGGPRQGTAIRTPQQVCSASLACQGALEGACKLWWLFRLLFLYLFITRGFC